MSREESDRRAAAGEPFALRYRVPRGEGRILQFVDGVYGAQSKLADEVEDFALLRSDGMPTYHLASCADDADLRISHIIRGQDHLDQHLQAPAHLRSPGRSAAAVRASSPARRSRWRQTVETQARPVVSVTTYRDAGFLPQAFVNFLCLLGWSPKNDREFLTLEELTAAFTLEGVNRANAVVNFSEATPSIPKPSGSTPNTSAPCPSTNSARASSRFLNRPAFTPRRKSCSPLRRSSASASSC